MNTVNEQYRGFTITVTPIKDHEDLWDFEYLLESEGTAARAPRKATLGGHLGPEIACAAGLELAKVEVDNLLALTA